jgi:hypothetical protein
VSRGAFCSLAGTWQSPVVVEVSAKYKCKDAYKVRDLDGAVCVEKKVLQLEVLVYNLLLVQPRHAQARFSAGFSA